MVDLGMYFAAARFNDMALVEEVQKPKCGLFCLLENDEIEQVAVCSHNNPSFPHNEDQSRIRVQTLKLSCLVHVIAIRDTFG